MRKIIDLSSGDIFIRKCPLSIWLSSWRFCIRSIRRYHIRSIRRFRIRSIRRYYISIWHCRYFASTLDAVTALVKIIFVFVDLPIVHIDQYNVHDQFYLEFFVVHLVQAIALNK